MKSSVDNISLRNDLHAAFFFSTDDTFSAMFLLDHGAQINGKRSFDSNTPLHLTAQHSSLVRVAQTLLDKGASTNDTNLDGL